VASSLWCVVIVVVVRCLVVTIGRVDERSGVAMYPDRRRDTWS